MYESDIVRNLLPIIDDNVRRLGGHRATRVVLEVAPLSHARPRVLHDCFDRDKGSSTAATAVLVIRTQQRARICLDCQRAMMTSDNRTQCPHCGGDRFCDAGPTDVFLACLDIEV